MSSLSVPKPVPSVLMHSGKHILQCWEKRLQTEGSPGTLATSVHLHTVPLYSVSRHLVSCLPESINPRHCRVPPEGLFQNDALIEISNTTVLPRIFFQVDLKGRGSPLGVWLPGSSLGRFLYSSHRANHYLNAEVTKEKHYAKETISSYFTVKVKRNVTYCMNRPVMTPFRMNDKQIFDCSLAQRGEKCISSMKAVGLGMQDRKTSKSAVSTEPRRDVR